MSKCFTLGGSQNGTDFIRSQFDYGVRQRRAVRSYPVHNFTISVEPTELASFQSFWLALNEGTDIWLTDQIVHGDLTTDKEVRFIRGYTLEELSYNRWRISCSIELIKTGV